MRATPTGSSPPTSHDSRLPQSDLADVCERSCARRRLRAHGRRDRPRLRRPSPRQLRVRAADHGRRVRARLRLAVGLPELGLDPLLLWRRARAVHPDGLARLPAPAHPLAGRDARGDVRGRLPPAEHRAARVRAVGEERRVAGDPQRALGRRRRLHQEDRGDLGRDCRRLPRDPAAPAHANAAGAAHARGIDGLPDGSPARRSRQPGDLGSRDHLGTVRGRVRGDAERAGAHGRTGVRHPGHDPRACRRGARRAHPAGTGHGWGLRDRLRERDPRWSAPVEPEPVPAEFPVRSCDRGAAGPAGRPLHARPRFGGAGMSVVRRIPELLVPAVLILGTALLGLEVSSYLQAYFLDTLVKVAIVVALYVFIGNSGVLSFGHISFVALGAWTAGVLTVPRDQKLAIMPGLSHFLVVHNVGNIASLALAAAVGGAFALVVGLPLMRLSGLAAGIATFGVLEITNNVLTYDQSIGPGLNAFSSVPSTTGIWQAAIAALISAAVAYLYQRTRFGRMLRATREDPAAAAAAGISIYRQRLLAFTVAGALAGLAGGLYVHLQPLQEGGLSLNLTFITLAMLVVGGSGSLLGAVVGALALNGLFSFFSAATNTVDVFGWNLTVPSGTAELALRLLMAIVLILRPSGLPGGRELSLPRRRAVARLEKARATT